MAIRAKIIAHAVIQPCIYALSEFSEFSELSDHNIHGASMSHSQPGFIRRGFGFLWRLLDGSRRLFFNLLFLLFVLILLLGIFGGAAKRLDDKTALVLDLTG